VWTIYDRPLDQPHAYLARKWLLWEGAHGPGTYGPTTEVLIATTLADLRMMLPLGLTRRMREPADHPKIIETWL